MVVNTINELIELLNQVDIDATVLAAISNDSAVSVDNGPSAGLVTTRLGSNVKNVQKVIADIENGITTGIRPEIQDSGVTIVDNPAAINFEGVNVGVADVGGVATVTVSGVSKVGTPVDNEIGVWTGDGTLEGSQSFIFDGTTLTVRADVTPTINIVDGNDAITYSSSIFNNGGDPITIIGNTTANDLRINTDNISRLTVFKTGEIGIGTNTPTKILTISDASPVIRMEDETSGTNVGEITVDSAEMLFDLDAGNTTANSEFVFNLDGSEVMRINDLGYVGIGETNPQNVLEVRAPGAEMSVNDTTGVIGTGNIDCRIGLQANGTTGFEFGFLNTTSGQVSVRNRVEGDMRFRLENTIHDFRFEENTGTNLLATINTDGLAIESPGGLSTDGGTTFFTYAEGTFTPEVADAITGGNVATATNAVGSYIKIGKMVQMTITLDAIDTTGLTGAQALHIRNLPFTADSVAFVRNLGSVILGDVAFTNLPTARMSEGDSSLTLVESATGGATTNILVSALTSPTADIYITMVYRAA